MRVFRLTICVLLALAAPAAALDASLAKQVLAEINLARSEPRTYAGFLREFRRLFQGKIYMLPGSNTRMHTKEGAAAVDEAIRYLSRQKPLPTLTWSDGLAAAAAELAEEQGESGGLGHNGSRSHGVQERIERHGKWDRQIAENISYGPKDARGVVMHLIIDDGVKDRGHRTNTFRPALRTAGVTCGSHPRYGGMCVIDFAGGFSE